MLCYGLVQKSTSALPTKHEVDDPWSTLDRLRRDAVNYWFLVGNTGKQSLHMYIYIYVCVCIYP